jgi:uncharacterized membrane protein HdeD (DUF308 family)
MAKHQAKLPMWARALAILVGLVSIAAAFIVLLFPGIALLTLVILLGIALMFVGLDRLIAGISGHPYEWMSVVAVEPTRLSETKPAAPQSPS